MSSTRYGWSILVAAVVSLGAATRARVPDAVEIRPVGLTSIDVAPYSTTTQRFWVVNTGDQANQYGLFANVCTPHDLYCEWSNPFLGTIAPNDSVPVDVTFTAGHAGTSGTIAFEARINTNQSVRASKSVTVNARQEAHLQVAALNPGTAEERDLCLTVAVATDAAYECGDLRLVHALPSVRMRGTVRTPTLLYNSRFAHPFGLVSATLSVPPQNATNVTARLTVPRPSGDIVVTQGFADALFTASSVRKFAMAFDASTLPTGVYPYTLRVTMTVGGTPDTLSASGSLIVVNRKASVFGAGWWVAGYEHLYPQPDSSLLWVGGDGSARQYTAVGSGVYKAAGIDRPDSIVIESGVFVRHLRHRAAVEFSPNGNHSITRDRLGVVTAFHHDQFGKLVHIDPAGLDTLRYNFSYITDTGPLELVIAPPVGGATRWVLLDVLGNRVLSFREPDNTSFVEFGYGSGVIPDQIASRTNRRGVVQSFAYDAAGKLVTVRVPLNASDTAVTTFCPGESRGLVSTSCSSGPLHPDSAVTVMDGPRTDATDVTTFRLDRFGAPRVIRDALGNATQLFRGNREFPGLVTRIVHANGWVNDAYHDAKGLLTKLVQGAPLGPDRDAVTEYTWDPKWERVTQITFPEQNVLQFAYDSLTGNRLWQQDGRGAPSRADFAYYGTGAGTARSLLASVTYPADPANVRARDSLLYDSLGNVAEERRAVGTASEGVTRYATDAIGRTREIRTLIDTTGAEQIDSTTYDVLDRVVLTKSFGPALSNAPAATLFAHRLYDAEGNVRRVARWGSPDPTAIDTIVSRTGYDLADRVVADTAPDLRVETRAYDRAGNLTSTTSRRGHTIGLAYDALNRLTSRTLPAVTYGDTGITVGAVDTASFPRRPNSGDDYVIAADTDAFTYDAMGRIATANNGDARVTRTYFANGLLETERLEIRNARSSTFGHDYLTQFRYDLNGRRTRLHLPSQLTTGTEDSLVFAYNDTTGELTTIRDVLGRDYTYAYTLRGEPRSLTMPGNYEERWSYFPDGGLQTDSIRNLGSTTGGRVPFPTLRASSFNYDRRGKRLATADAWGFQEGHEFAYTGLGYVASSQIRQNGVLVTGGGTASHVFRSGEQLAYDAFGNLASALTVDSIRVGSTDSTTSLRGRTAAYLANIGRLDQEASAEGNKRYLYDPAGNLELSIREEANSPDDHPRENRFTYYGPDERVRAVDARSGFPGDRDLQLKKWTFDEYRYDALGRRVWVQSDRQCDEERDVTLGDEWLECNIGVVRRTVWDGEQELFEIQVPYRLPGGQPQADSVLENDDYLPQLGHFGGANDPNPFFGRVLYVHGLVLDQPLAIVRYNYVDFFNTTINRITFPPTGYSLFWNALGKLGPVVCGSGQAECTQTGGGRMATMGMLIPSNWFVLDRAKYAGAQRYFQGTLTADKADATGVLYRRNRYYDPSTGRFTQEDPVGLDGGLNLYGVADGDPVNLSDPFGLWPCCFVETYQAAYAHQLEQQAAAENAIRLDWLFGAQEALAGDAMTRFAAAGISGVGGRVRNPGGMLGKPSTRAQVSGVADALEARGWTITGGGGRLTTAGGNLPEEYLPGLGGGRLGSSRPDITATKNGRVLRVNTIDTRADGVTPTTREARNAARIRAQRPNDKLLLVPKPK